MTPSARKTLLSITATAIGITVFGLLLRGLGPELRRYLRIRRM